MTKPKAKTILAGGTVILLTLIAVLFLFKQKAEEAGVSRVATESQQAIPVKMSLAQPSSTTFKGLSRMDWRKVESTDYRQYLANLRAIHMPEPTIRDVIVADVNQLFQSKFDAIKATNTFEFWKSDPIGGFKAAVKTLQQEKQALLKELLGIEMAGTVDNQDPFQAALDPLAFLPEEKQSKVKELEAVFRAKKPSRDTPVDGRQFNVRIALEKEGELAKILTPQEKAEYDLRVSDTALHLRILHNQYFFDPTEQEFRTLIKIQHEFEEAIRQCWLTTGRGLPPEELKVLKGKIDQKIQKALGEERYKQYRPPRMIIQSGSN